MRLRLLSALVALAMPVALAAQTPNPGAPIPMEAGPEFPPKLKKVRQWYWPAGRAADGARVTLMIVIDTAGQIEPGSIRVVASSDSSFNTAAISTMTTAVFQPARIGKRSVRTQIVMPLVFKPGQAAKPCQQILEPNGALHC